MKWSFSYHRNTLLLRLVFSVNPSRPTPRFLYPKPCQMPQMLNTEFRPSVQAHAHSSSSSESSFKGIYGLTFRGECAVGSGLELPLPTERLPEEEDDDHLLPQRGLANDSTRSTVNPGVVVISSSRHGILRTCFASTGERVASKSMRRATRSSRSGKSM